MRRVSYKSVRERASALWVGEAAGTAQDAAVLDVFLNRRAGEFWESFWWPDWTVSERRQFRADWAIGTTYGAPSSTVAVEVYYPPAGKYYQSLVAGNVGNVPATGTALAENSAFWAECAGTYSGADWATGAVFAVGTRTRNPADNRYYQCVVPHTAGASFDGTKFGILTPFVRSIDYEQAGQTVIGEVRTAWDKDPLVFERSERCEFPVDLIGGRVIVRGTLPVVYLEFRKRPSSWTGDDWVGGVTTYGLAAQVYDPTEGDYFASAQAGNTGHGVTDTTWWTRLEFPYVLRDCAAQGAYADMLRADGQLEKWVVEDAEAKRLRDVAVGVIERQQRQNGSMRVLQR